MTSKFQEVTRHLQQLHVGLVVTGQHPDQLIPEFSLFQKVIVQLLFGFARTKQQHLIVRQQQVADFVEIAVFDFLFFPVCMVFVVGPMIRIRSEPGLVAAFSPIPGMRFKSAFEGFRKFGKTIFSGNQPGTGLVDKQGCFFRGFHGKSENQSYPGIQTSCLMMAGSEIEFGWDNKCRGVKCMQI